MRFGTLGKLDWQPSALGFGAMRFPIVGDDRTNIDQDRAAEMLHYALEHGVNYIDTAYFYHGGASEAFLGRALQGSYRGRARVATKLPCGRVKNRDDFDRILDEQLERLQRDHVDFYLLHGLNAESWNSMRKLDILSRAERAVSDGRVGELGFSFHDKLSVFKDIVDGYDNWALCQIQYNYVDVDYQAGRAGLHYAAQRGLGVVIMEPLRGGQLAKEPPPTVAPLWREAGRPWSQVEWALHWLWDQPEISVVLSGMSTLEQVQENVRAASRSVPENLTGEERALFDRLRKAYLSLRPIPCTGCGYCLPCPSGVAIPNVFEQYNNAVAFDDMRRGRMGYRMLNEARRADKCTACHSCEECCPQGIEVSRWMPKIHASLAEDT